MYLCSRFGQPVRSLRFPESSDHGLMAMERTICGGTEEVALRNWIRQNEADRGQRD